MRLDKSIFTTEYPYQVRFNCKEGKLSIGTNNHLGDTAEFAILSAARWFGDMGMTIGTEWLQIFYVGAPNCHTLPKDTVCCSYLKTRSLAQFQRTLTKVMASGENPAKGIFAASFADHVSGSGHDYKSVEFEYRDRTEDEIDQLHALAEFMQGAPVLEDVRNQHSLQSLDGMSAMEVQWFIDRSNAKRNKP
jgi:hypothetical protein